MKYSFFYSPIFSGLEAQYQLQWSSRMFSNIFLCDISGAHGDNYEGGCHLKCCALYSRRNWLTFLRFSVSIVRHNILDVSHFNFFYVFPI